MAITYVGACTGGGGSGSVATRTLTLPAGAAVDDVVIAFSANNSNVATATFDGATPTFGPITSNANLREYAHVWTLTGTGTFDVTWSASGRVVVTALVFRGVGAVDVSNSGTTVAASLTVPAVTTTVAGCLLVTGACARVATGTAAAATFPNGTQAGQATTTAGSGVNLSVEASYQTVGAAGSYGSGTITTSPSATNLNAFTIAVAPGVTNVTADVTATATAGATVSGVVTVTAGTTATITAGSTATAAVGKQGAVSASTTAGANVTAVTGPSSGRPPGVPCELWR